MHHIKGYSRTELQVDNGESIIISKYKYAEFIKAYMDYISRYDDVSEMYAVKKYMGAL